MIKPRPRFLIGFEFFNVIPRSRRQVVVRLSQVTVFHLTLVPRDYITRVALLFAVTAQGFRRRTMADEVVRRHRYDDFTKSQQETLVAAAVPLKTKQATDFWWGVSKVFVEKKASPLM